jgi:hypothetical protein
MAVTKTLIVARPYENSSNEVERWELEMKYSQGTEGQANYFEAKYSTTVHATEPKIATFENGATDTYTTTTNFTELDKTAWSLAELTALCPTTQWDTLFDNQYDCLITTPLAECVPDEDFDIPT